MASVFLFLAVPGMTVDQPLDSVLQANNVEIDQQAHTFPA